MSVQKLWNKAPINEMLSRAQNRLVAIGFQISRDAKLFCPSQTGRLRASISVNWTGSGMEYGETGSWKYGEIGVEEVRMDGIKEPPQTDMFTVVVGSNVRYAPFVEFGTVKMGNTPFLRAAFEKNRQLVSSSGTVQRKGDIYSSWT